MAQLSPCVSIGEDCKERDDEGGGLHGRRVVKDESGVATAKRVGESSIMAVIWEDYCSSRQPVESRRSSTVD